jgi:hypothetical protein
MVEKHSFHILLQPFLIFISTVLYYLQAHPHYSFTIFSSNSSSPQLFFIIFHPILTQAILYFFQLILISAFPYYLSSHPHPSNSVFLSAHPHLSFSLLSFIPSSPKHFCTSTHPHLSFSLLFFILSSAKHLCTPFSSSSSQLFFIIFHPILTKAFLYFFNSSSSQHFFIIF